MINEELDTVTLFIDEELEESGIEAISLVDSPAIEEDFIALSKEEVMLKTLDDDQRILVGYALVPDKKILRKKGDYLYNITFPKETVQKAAELYLKRLKNNNTTTEHQNLVNGVSVIESWVVEDEKMDKINLYGLKPIIGGWAVKMKVYNDAVWEEVKAGKYSGFSIEGYNFISQKEEGEKTDEYQNLMNKLKTLFNNGNNN